MNNKVRQVSFERKTFMLRDYDVLVNGDLSARVNTSAPKLLVAADAGQRRSLECLAVGGTGYSSSTQHDLVIPE